MALLDQKLRTQQRINILTIRNERAISFDPHSPVEDVFGVDVLLELLDGRQEVVRVLCRLSVPLTWKNI